MSFKKTLSVKEKKNVDWFLGLIKEWWEKPSQKNSPYKLKSCKVCPLRFSPFIDNLIKQSFTLV